MVEINAINFSNKSSFFFDVTKIYPCINGIDDLSKLKANPEEIGKLNEMIQTIRLNISKNISYKEITILPEFKAHIDNMKSFDYSKTLYAQRINDIIKEERKNNDKVITLTKIKNSYNNKFFPNISLSTVNRIIKNHLNLHFKRIKIRNPKLNKKNYKFMHYIYLKVVLKAILQNLDLIFVDETACYLGNDNYRDWVAENDEIIKGAESGLKSRISIIMAINLKRIIHYKIIENNVTTDLFGEFIDEFCKKLSNHQKKIL